MRTLATIARMVHSDWGAHAPSRAGCGASPQPYTFCFHQHVETIDAATVGEAPTGTREGACAPQNVPSSGCRCEAVGPFGAEGSRAFTGAATPSMVSIHVTGKWRRCQSASVLVGLLWCLALLSVVVIGVLHTASLDLRVVKNYGDQIQAHYLALAGIEKAKALIYHDALDRRRSAKNHTGDLLNAADHFRDVALGRGQFRVFHQGGREEGGGIVYGITDEESRLNANTASVTEFGKLYGMTPDVAAAIVDYRDEDSTVTPNGAEAAEYAALQPPYQPRNGPLQSLRELLMVRGMPRDLLLGEDANQNGILDAAENDGNESLPPDNRDGVLDPGWAGILTVHSVSRDVNAAGESRINVQSADEASLSAVKGLSSDIAKAIVAYRSQNRLESLADLLDVAAAAPQNLVLPPPDPGSANRSADRSTPTELAPNRGVQAQQFTGPKLISEDLLLEIADDLTTAESQEASGLININTASAEVLACLPGIDPNLAQTIISHRQSSGFFPNVTWLLRAPGMTRQIFKQVAPRITARSETFRILSEGKVNSTGARKRIMVVVHAGAYSIDTLAYREDDL